MTGLRSMLGRLFGGMTVRIEGAPEAELSVAPDSVNQVARLLDFASEHGLTVLPWGSGIHQGFGARLVPDIIISTARLDRVVEWNPDDLTVTVGSGLTLGALQETVAARHQTAVLPEQSLGATVGGVIAAGMSGWRRLRYGPTRDRVLQVELVTGDGRVVIGGARVVKNVTGYDLPRLITGSFGALGVITSTCLKLWPEPERSVTVSIDDVERALAIAYRPYAVLETPGGAAVYLGGTDAEVEAQATALGGAVRDGFLWPPEPDGECAVRVRVPPSDVSGVVARLGQVEFVAAHGVGEVVAGVESSSIEALREWAESRGGAVVVERAPGSLYESIDPWGAPPPSVELQRRIKAAFDPMGVLVPGRLPGGL